MPVPEDDRSPAQMLNGWSEVDISENGTFKYVLIEAYATEKATGKTSTKQGYIWRLYIKS